MSIQCYFVIIRQKEYIFNTFLFSSHEKEWIFENIILQHGRGRGLSAYLKSNSDSLQWTTPGMQSSESFISSLKPYLHYNECYHLVQRAPKQHWLKSSQQTLTSIILTNHSTRFLTHLLFNQSAVATSLCCFHAVISTIHSSLVAYVTTTVIVHK